MNHRASILQLLDRFNRKERFFLVGYALGNAGFQLSDEFRRDLTKHLRAVDGSEQLRVPRDAYCWMDYHIDWVWAALELYEGTPDKQQFESPGWPGKDGEPLKNVNANQEDTDLLVAWADPDGTHLVFIEAKGATNFSIGQMESKGRRLERLFGATGTERNSVRPHFLVASPRHSTRLNKAKAPAWMKPGGEFAWMPLRIPPDRIQIERFDEEHGSSKNASGWRVKTESAESEASVPDDAES